MKPHSLFALYSFMPPGNSSKIQQKREERDRKPTEDLRMMKLYLFSILTLLFSKGLCDSYINKSYKLRLAVPGEYSSGFVGRAFLMQTNQTEPSFRTALTIEAVNGRYSCSLHVFLGDVKVWNSGHYSHFFTSEVCLLELTQDGDLQLKSLSQVGWRSGTSGQGVERLQILETGNLVLVDPLGSIKWQSFNFPTDVMLWGQKLDLATKLTSFPTNNNTSFYTFEIEENKVGLYLNTGELKYCYWEFKPSKCRNLTFVQLGSRGLLLFNDKRKKIAQIPSGRTQPIRFLAFGNGTGNLGLYFYSPYKTQFQASFQALNTTCDLPLACKPYGICTFSNSCSCIKLSSTSKGSSNCSEGVPTEFCGNGPVEMLELQGINSSLFGAPVKANISKEACSTLCLHDCKCLAALYSSGNRECSMYRQVVGIRQVDRAGTELSYLVKVPKGSHGNHSKIGVKKWVLVVVVVVDALVILLIIAGLAGYLIHKRRKKSEGTNTTT